MLAFASLTVIVLTVFAYGAWTFRSLEARMQAVNDLYVPSLKALNQLESSFFLLESDLDKSLREGILRPNDTLESVMSSRLDFLGKLAGEGRDRVPDLQRKVTGLSKAYAECALVLHELYADWAGRLNQEAVLSAKRADFRFQLKSLIRDVDLEMRAVSAEVQSELGRIGIALTLVLAFCCGLALVLSYWLADSLRPLETLAQVIRNISHGGLNETIVRELSDIPVAHDEVGTLARESQNMAASLLDNNKALYVQKGNLERAHSELARQHEELKNTKAKLLHSEKLGLVGRMAAQMAHEIRNPLNALNLHAEILEDQLKQDPVALDNLAPLRKEINRLITVTESYLDLSRGPRLRKGQVQLNDLVEELQDLYQPLLKEKGIYFSCDLGQIPMVSVDRSQFSQVLGNLVKNASEAFEEGGAVGGKRYIRLITHHDTETGNITISVMDNGAGIPQDQQKNIFSPFFTSKAQGTGLGLTFSRQVVEAHGGEITFDSAAHQGTKFTLRLPAGKVNIREDRWKATGLES